MEKCKNCGKDFHKEHFLQKHCSTACKNKYMNKLRLERIKLGLAMNSKQFVNTTGFFDWKEYGENIII